MSQTSKTFIALAVIFSFLYLGAEHLYEKATFYPPFNQVPFSATAWKEQKEGAYPSSGVYRAQMVDAARRMISGKTLPTILKELGPPDWVGTPHDIESSQGIRGDCVISYALDAGSEEELCISVYSDSRFESSFETVWGEKV